MRRLAALGLAPEADDAAQLRHGSLTLLVTLVIAASPVWIVTYLILDRPLSATIPAAYVVFSIASLVLLARTKRAAAFVATQIGLFLALPVLLQWSLGGFVNGSAVSLWAFTAPLTALLVWGTRRGMLTLTAYAVLVVGSVAAEPMLQRTVAPLPEVVTTAFWALNVIVPLTTSFLLLAYVLRQRDIATARSEELLLNILPASVATRLKQGRAQVADRVPEASVLFADIVDFTPLAERTTPEEVVDLLGRIFSALDSLAGRHGVEKIKTLGDGYLAVAGLPDPRPDHASAAAAMALEVAPALEEAVGAASPALRVRVGIASGPVVAGVIGSRRFSYDLWGDTVNLASRMASTAAPGTVQVAESTARLLGSRARLERLEAVEIKGKGPMTTYRLLALEPDSSPPSTETGPG